MTPTEILAWLRLFADEPLATAKAKTFPAKVLAAADLIESLQAENKSLTKQNKILQLKIDGQAHDFCPDHRDKQRGKTCLACENERLRKIVDESVPVLESLVHAFGDCLVRDRAKAIIARAREEG